MKRLLNCLSFDRIIFAVVCLLIVVQSVLVTVTYVKEVKMNEYLAQRRVIRDGQYSELEGKYQALRVELETRK